MKKMLQLLIMLTASLSFTAYAQERTIEIVREGNVIFSSPVTNIDYMDITMRLPMPINIQATVSGTQVVVSWAEVDGATSYEVERSADGINWIPVASVSNTSYTDATPMIGLNYYRVRALGSDGATSLYSAASQGVQLDTTAESGLYLGIVGFNNKLYHYPISKLDETTKAGFDAFIDGLTVKNGTYLYYGVDEGINRLQSQSFPSDLFSVAMITFTDGLDVGSGKYAPQYSSDEEYGKALNERIRNEKVSEKQLIAYSIGLLGDINPSDTKGMQLFRYNLKSLSSEDGNAYEVDNMSEVNNKFQEIAKQLSETNTVQKLTLVLPWGYPGTRFRITFDNVKSATASQLYIEGVYAAKEPSDVGDVIRLNDLQFRGMESTSPLSVKGVINEDSYYIFEIEGIVTESKIPLTVKKGITLQYIYKPDIDYWQENTEFDPDAGSKLITEKRSAAIMLNLDCSSSLVDVDEDPNSPNTDFAKMKEAAKEFIETLLKAQGYNPENPDKPVNPEVPSSIFSTTPVDLALAMDKDGQRYYIKASDYQKYSTQLIDYTPVGVCVLSAKGDFIVALRNANDNYTISYNALTLFFDNEEIPTQDEGIVISARLDEINDALKSFGGYVLKTNTGTGTWVYGQCKKNYRYTVIKYSGGEVTATDSDLHFFRPVISLDGTFTSFCSNHLKPVFSKDGERKCMVTPEIIDGYTPDGYKLEGIYVKYPKLPGFIVELKDINPSTVNYSAATSLYGDYLPSINQGIAMSACLNKLSNVLKYYGGYALDNTDTGTWVYGQCNKNYSYTIIRYSGGEVTATDSDMHYVRRVINCSDIE